MIKLFRINNIALVAELELELGPGLTLLTGETGAGKSIVIDALGLLLGARASSELLRTGETRGSVEAVIESGEARARLHSDGVLAEDDELILRREILAEGRGRAAINGALVPLNVFKTLAPCLGAIHGQHEPQGLLDPQTHLPLVDHHAGLEALAARVAEAHRDLRGIETALEALHRDRRELERRREALEYQLAEIEKARLRPGEQEALAREKTLQANADRLAGLSAEAYALLYDDEAAVLPRLGRVYRRVEELAAIDPSFAPYLEARAAVRAQAEDLAFFLRDYRERLQVAPGRLDEIESRLALLDRLKKKYGASLEAVLDFAERARRELQDLEAPEERERTLTGERTRALAAYLALARDLSSRRRAAARRLESQVEAELGLVAMQKTRFKVRFDPDLPGDGDAAGFGEHGLETAELLLSPNLGEELRPLARIASGGELSRILLALKSVASLDGAGKTLVFDEVDAGIGGGVAEVVGRKLKALAARHQVLCVTHLPQIAAFADTHFAVRKRVARGRTLTEVVDLDEAGRIEELARMLGGETITDTARKHAREMMKQSLRQ